MTDLSYTLNDPIFGYGLSRGSDSEEFFDDSGRLMVVGGASTQLNTRDKPELLRPTTDIDFIRSKPTTRTQKKIWAGNLAKKIDGERYTVMGGLSRYGAEVRFTNSHPDFILHLDCYSPNFFNIHNRRIEGEFERAEMVEIDKKPVRYHSPMDVIINKIRRVRCLERAKLVTLSPNQKHFLNLVSDAQFDDIDTSDLEGNLETVLKVRSQTVEDLGRYGYQQIIQEVENYKITKDLCDITSILGYVRRAKVTISPQEFRSALDLALIDVQ
ncbi:MAG TPA: hypothetical protein VMC80_02545 [Patescibacteria group bacterium]|nr:hypothetical protein [Patescibacteria group bacterium]